jgi:type IV pilus assembly protein PilC
MFSQFGKELPAFSQAFMNAYDFICHNTVYVLLGLAGLVCTIIIAARTKRGHTLLSRLVLSTPVFGRLRTEAFVTIFCRTFATLVESGVPMLEILNILGSMAANDIIRTAVTTTREHLVGGSNLSLSMSSSGFFPNMLVKMVQVGEESGSLPTVLERTGNHYERRLNATIDALTILLEPILIVTIGAIVLVVAIALYLPIFTMSGT